jgi:hypothetical protein
MTRADDVAGSVEALVDAIETIRAGLARARRGTSSVGGVAVVRCRSSASTTSWR